LITVSFITEISFARRDEDYKIGAALLSKVKSAAPIIIPVPPTRCPRDRGRHYPKPIAAISGRKAV
jgi:hypothetical protein